MQFLYLVLLREAVVVPPRRENKNSDLLMAQCHSSTCRDSHFVWKGRDWRWEVGAGRRIAGVNLLV